MNESAVIGELAPLLREAGGDVSAVTSGTRVVSDWLVVRVTNREGEDFLDHMIAMVEGAKRDRTPNEIALSILLAALTIVFLLATATLLPFWQYAVASTGAGSVITVTVLVAPLACLIPTTIQRLPVGHRTCRHREKRAATGRWRKPTSPSPRRPQCLVTETGLGYRLRLP